LRELDQPSVQVIRLMACVHEYSRRFALKGRAPGNQLFLNLN
jgi:hypothetical protein